MTEKRSAWPAARHLQQAAAEIREATACLPTELQDLSGPVADWLDRTALEAAWLAPYRPHLLGHLPWQIATRAAHGVLNLPDADTCTTCHSNAEETEVTE